MKNRRVLSKIYNYLYGANFSLFPDLSNTKSSQIMSVGDEQALKLDCQQVLGDLSAVVKEYN